MFEHEIEDPTLESAELDVEQDRPQRVVDGERDLGKGSEDDGVSAVEVQMAHHVPERLDGVAEDPADATEQQDRRTFEKDLAHRRHDAGGRGQDANPRHHCVGGGAESNCQVGQRNRIAPGGAYWHRSRLSLGNVAGKNRRDDEVGEVLANVMRQALEQFAARRELDLR